MAWRYKVTSVNPLTDEDYIEFNVEFSNTTPGDTRIKTKLYRVYSADLPDTTIQSLKVIVDADKLLLTKFDQLAAALTAVIGNYY